MAGPLEDIRSLPETRGESVVRSDEKSAAERQGESPSIRSHTRIDNRHDHAAGGQVRPGATQLEGGLPDIARGNEVIDVDSGNSRREFFEDGMDHADIVVGQAEVGQECDGAHRMRLAQVPSRVEPTSMLEAISALIG